LVDELRDELDKIVHDFGATLKTIADRAMEYKATLQGLPDVERYTQETRLYRRLAHYATLAQDAFEHGMDRAILARAQVVEAQQSVPEKVQAQAAQLRQAQGIEAPQRTRTQETSRGR
jgi:hypothetical protein